MADGDLNELMGILAESALTGTASSFGEHPRFSQYKNVQRAEESQKKRRLDFLERQKEARFDHANHARKLALNEFDEADEPMDEDDEEVKKKTHRGGRRCKSNRYADELMTSEWLVDIPETLSSEWSCIPCPLGKRCLVIASNGVTTAYSKSGYLVKQFSSYLPGGNRSSTNPDRYSLVDCVFDPRASTFYCLDLIAWNGVSISESDFNCRSFMLNSKISENENFSEKSPQFPYAFVCLPCCPCEKALIEELMRREFPFTVDGVLFYYCLSPYFHGQSPLVGWLKPWMLPEILSVDVPPSLMEGKVTSSGESQKFIDSYNKTFKHCSKISKEPSS